MGLCLCNMKGILIGFPIRLWNQTQTHSQWHSPWLLRVTESAVAFNFISRKNHQSHVSFSAHWGLWTFYSAFAEGGPSLQRFFLGGGGGEMVIGWIESRDLFETSGRLTRNTAIVIAEESRMFSCVLSLRQWCCYRNFEPRVLHTNVHAGCGRSYRRSGLLHCPPPEANSVMTILQVYCTS